MIIIGSLAAVSVLAGAVAGIAGFGIGTLVTPVLTLWWGTKLAVAMVAIPHLAGTALRFWLLRHRIDRRVLGSFGSASALGGLLGAWLHVRFASTFLRIVLGGLLVCAGVAGLTGAGERLRVKGAVAWAAGVLSGFLGGLVGHQGGIRTAAMLGLEVPRDAFIATTTAVALIIDGVRIPFYLASHTESLSRHAPVIAMMTAGTLVGTIVGCAVLKEIPERLFRRVISGPIVALGLFMLLRADPS